MNKRGADITTVMIFLVVGLVVGVLLIWGFATNWAVFSTLFSSGNNVNVIVTQCQTACTSLDNYGFCSMSRTLKAVDLPNDANGNAQKELTNNCKFFSTLKNKNGESYGISTCPNLCP